MSGDMVKISGADGEFAAYVAEPDGAPKGAVVVIQEIFGVNAGIRGVADWLASEGYVAVAPDLFWRVEPGIELTDQSQAEWDKAFELYNAFDVAKGVEDIQSTIAFARNAAPKVGAVGYCLGGLLAYLTSTRTDVDASVGYYGVGIDTVLAEAGDRKNPLMLHIAEEDGFVSKDAQAKIHETLTSDGITIHDYAGRDHAFARKGGEHYHEADAATANGRTLAFFGEHLS